jgi:translation elongation factor EF-G
VPTFIFVNKTDIAVKRKEELEKDLKKALSPLCVSFHEAESKQELDERLADVSEDFMESFFGEIAIEDEEIAQKISERKLFPCFFGSALKMQGIEFLLDGIDRYTLLPVYEEDFGAKVYKIARAQGERMTYMKLTGGSLCARDEVTYLAADGKKYTEKVSRIRLYSGDKFEQTDSVSAGEICAVLGLSATYIGQGLGTQNNTCKPILEPVLAYRIILPEGCDPILYFPKFKELEEEDPSLHL